MRLTPAICRAAALAAIAAAPLTLAAQERGDDRRDRWEDERDGRREREERARERAARERDRAAAERERGVRERIETRVEGRVRDRIILDDDVREKRPSVRVYTAPRATISSDRIVIDGDRVVAATVPAGEARRAVLGINTSAGGARDTLGLLVTNVVSEGPADRAGLAEGARLLSINGVSLRVDPEDAGDPAVSGLMSRRLTREMAKLAPGDEAELRVWNDGRTRTLRVRTIAAAELSAPKRESVAAGDRAVLGLTLQPGSGRRDTLGILVIGVVEDGPADRAGLQEGDRIVEVNGQDLRVSRDEAGDAWAANFRHRRFSRELEKTRPGERLDLRVWSGGRERNLDVRVGRHAEVYGRSTGSSPRSGSMYFFDGGAASRAPLMAPMAPMPPMPAMPAMPPMPARPARPARPMRPSAPEAIRVEPGSRWMTDAAGASEPLIDGEVLRAATVEALSAAALALESVNPEVLETSLRAAGVAAGAAAREATREAARAAREAARATADALRVDDVLRIDDALEMDAGPDGDAREAMRHDDAPLRIEAPEAARGAERSPELERLREELHRARDESARLRAQKALGAMRSASMTPMATAPMSPLAAMPSMKTSIGAAPSRARTSGREVGSMAGSTITARGSGEGYVLRLGRLALTPVTRDLADYLGEGSERGLLVVETGAPWAAVREGDVLLRVNGRPVRSGNGAAVTLHTSGTDELELLRGGRVVRVRE